MKRPSDYARKIDYSHKLSPTEARWLADFDALQHQGRTVVGIDPQEQLDAYDRNNRANRDLMNVARQVCAPKNAPSDWIDQAKRMTVDQLAELAPEGKAPKPRKGRGKRLKKVA